jgi:hypothetical protein
LPFSQFLNVVYHAMLTRLRYDDKNPEQPRRLLDQELGVSGWRSIGNQRPIKTKDVPDNAPAWWQGDEEASQSFMQSMRVVVTDGS